jgi:hypothetical protein
VILVAAVAAIGACIMLSALGSKARLTPFWVTISVSLLALPGYVALSGAGSNEGPTLAYASGLVALCAGYAVVGAHRGRPATERAPRGGPLSVLRDRRGLAVTTLVVAAFTSYHFRAGGVPILSENVELQRFAFTASGFFGLPGRIALFGTVILVFVALGVSRSASVGNRDLIRLITLPVTILLLTLVSFGFKSSILHAITILLFGVSLLYGGLGWRRFARWAAVPLLAALGFAIVISGQYLTVAQGGPTGIDYLLSRTTTGTAEPGFAVLSGVVWLPSGDQSILANDLAYYVPKYITGQGPAAAFPFVRVVSAAMYGTPLTEDSFIVPVTVGAVPSLLWEFGAVGFLLCAIIGGVYSYLERTAFRTRGPIGFTLGATAVVALNDYVTKGDLIYNLLNWGAVSLALVAVFRVARVAGSRRSIVGRDLTARNHLGPGG